MGGYDGQTVAGVISTSTHGSGITFGPLPEQIRSLDLVAGGGAGYRIERGDGPTDPAAFARRYPERRLVQGDEIGRASCRGRGEISGGAGSFKKKKAQKSLFRSAKYKDLRRHAKYRNRKGKPCES